MPERWITPPPDVLIMHPDTGEPAKDPEDEKKQALMAWKRIMLKLLAHPRLTSNLPAIKSCNLLRRKITASEVGVPFSVPEEDWRRLADVINDPDAGVQKIPEIGTLSSLLGMIGTVLPQLEDFFSAWTDAAPKKPEPKPAE